MWIKGKANIFYAWWRLFLREGDLMQELLPVDRFNLHENPISFAITFVLADGKGLPTFGRTLMDDIKL